MSYRFIPAKQILANTGKKIDPYFGIKYNMNLYRGCQHGCIYCDSRSECYRLGELSDIRVKENALELLEKEIKGKRIKGTIGFGSMNDCYMPVEKELELTRKALKIIAKYKFPIHIITKSDLVLRDIDLIKEISKVHATITITITTTDDNLAKLIEPNASSSSKRFEAIKTLNENGIQAGIIASPILPWITDSEENIVNIVNQAHKNKAKYLMGWMGMTIRDGQREYFYDRLEERFPSLKTKYIQQFADQYSCISPNSNYLTQLFHKERTKYGIPEKPEFYTPPTHSQLKLF